MTKKNVVCSSKILGREMHVNVYGSKGLPVVAFPTQGQSPESLEEVGLVDELEDYLDSGIIQLFCTETVDNESWGGEGDPAERAQRQEDYYHYVVDELVPLVAKMSKGGRPLALGFDAGATQASIVALRRPDLFQGCVCLSGCYDARRYFGDWMDATLYENTPCAFLPNMDAEHPYVALYNQRQLLFCTGQEASEADSLRSTREMEAQLSRLGVDTWCDYWGADVTHTWFWWKKQIRYFLPIVLADVEKTRAAEKPAKKRATTRKKAATTAKPATKADAATKKAEAEKKPTTTKAAAAKPAAKAATKTAAAKPAAAKAAATKTATTKAAAAKAAATKTEPKTAAKVAAVKPAAKKAETLAKATKAATPVKATKPATPAKAADVKPAATVAKKPAASKATAAKTTAAKTAAKPAAKATAAKTTAAKPAAKPAAKKAEDAKSAK